jgi:transcriptional regulator with XRE-family HTH domain
VKELPDRWRELGEFIREQRGMERLSLRRLSDLAGISNPYLSQIERGLRKPSAEILQQIARALRISAESLYERAGLLEAHDGDTADTVAVILRDPSLSDDARQTLIKVYRSLRTEPPEANGTPPMEHLPAAATPSGPATPGAPAVAPPVSGEPAAGESRASK